MYVNGQAGVSYFFFFELLVRSLSFLEEEVRWLALEVSRPNSVSGYAREQVASCALRRPRSLNQIFSEFWVC